MTRYASVYPLVTARAVARPFTYAVPDEVERGAIVDVRFGNARRRGIVTEVGVTPPEGVTVAAVEGVAQSLSPALVDLALWVADYYGSTPARALALVAPATAKRRGERRVVDGALHVGETPPERLSDSQAHALARIEELLDANGGNVLLAGATGSGKTEVYIRACAAALARGRGAIVLVPEIALTPQTLGRFRQRFGDRVAVLHSALSDAERRDERERIASGEAPVVVGARSAVFAPVKDLRLIVVDEEHEPAYKQDETPRYHGRDVAVYRAKLAHAVCLLGSATPSLESFANVKGGKYRLNTLTKRVDDKKMPDIQIVDMRIEVMRTRGMVTLSRLLVDHMHQRFARKEQIILFINRR
ncbi:MAG: primosomal protein N', partial [Actinomycetota bacterium]